MFNQVERCKFNGINRFEQMIKEEKYANKSLNPQAIKVVCRFFSYLCAQNSIFEVKEPQFFGTHH